MTDKLMNEFFTKFDKVFNNRQAIPLIPSNANIQAYDLFIANLSSKTMRINENPHLIEKLKDKAISYIRDDFLENKKNTVVDLHDFKTEYVYFILNAVRFGKRLPNQSMNKVIRYLRLWQYSGGFQVGSYEGVSTNDIRITYLLKHEMDLTRRYHKLLKAPYFIENVYYATKFPQKDLKREGKPITREKLLKSMKITSSMNENQCILFNEFVDGVKFTELINILREIVGKYYITGSIIDYINNTNLKPELYKNSDIDIVITDKLAFETLSGYLIAYLRFKMCMTMHQINKIVSYTGKYINLTGGFFSKRDVQIYHLKEKYGVFAHHFPCVRGYINSKGQMALSHQAIDIFRPNSDKKIRYIFMFPYTDVEKSASIIKKYRKRGYFIE